MREYASSRILWTCWLLVIGLSAPGCLSCTHPIPAPEPEITAPCQAVPPSCRKHVYIFILNGLDPLYAANLDGLRCYLTNLGFTQIYSGECYHAIEFGCDVRRIHTEDPDAHFVLIGFSAGANAAAYVADLVRTDKVAIDLLVYLDGCLLKDGAESRPWNACHILNIVGGCAKHHEGMENVDAPGVWHFGTPSHPVALCALARELTAIAEKVPFQPEPEPIPLLMPTPTLPVTPGQGLVPLPPPPADEMAPTPRPVVPQPTSERDDWDFLKPASTLQSLHEEGVPTGALKGKRPASVGTTEFRP